MMLWDIMGPAGVAFIGLIGIVILDAALFRIHERRHRGAEVMHFEPSDQFEMPPEMGIDYRPEQDETLS